MPRNRDANINHGTADKPKKEAIKPPKPFTPKPKEADDA